MPGLRSLRNRLAVIFALIILGAIGTIYLSVTPRLEASLTTQRLNGLVADSKRYLPGIARVLPANDPPPPAVDANTSKQALKAIKAKLATNARRRKERVAAAVRAADASGAEVLVYTVAPGGPYSVADSKPGGGLGTSDVGALAARAIRTGRQVTQTGPTAGGAPGDRRPADVRLRTPRRRPARPCSPTR